jgi:hypothetical protein
MFYLTLILMSIVGCCRWSKIPPAQEQRIISKSFGIFLVVHSLAHITLCAVAAAQLYNADLFWFLPFDLFSIIVGLIILSLIILVAGYAAASTNTVFSWILFHVFLWALIFIEIVTPFFLSDVHSLTELAHQAWIASTREEMLDMQALWDCCGFDNTSDTPNNNGTCSDTATPCRDWIFNRLTVFRNATVISLFMDFLFILLIDFVGCGICFHPDFITLDVVRQDDPPNWCEASLESSLSTALDLNENSTQVNRARKSLSSFRSSG